MPPTVLWRLCTLCEANTRHSGDVCENDPRHPDYPRRAPRQAQAFPEHTLEAAIWCEVLRR